MSLVEYWEEFPPMYVLLQGIASGMAGTRIGSSGGIKGSLGIGKPDSKVDEPLVNEIKDGRDLIGLLQTSGVNFGVLHG